MKTIEEYRIKQYPYLWVWTAKQGNTLTTSTDTILFRSPTFDFWRPDLQNGNQVPLAPGALEAQHHLLDFTFQFTSPSVLALTAGTLVIEGSANNETNDAQADLITYATFGLPVLLAAPTVNSNMVNPILASGIRIPCRFLRITISVTTSTGSNPTVVYFASIAARET